MARDVWNKLDATAWVLLALAGVAFTVFGLAFSYGTLYPVTQENERWRDWAFAHLAWAPLGAYIGVTAWVRWLLRPAVTSER